MLSVVCWKWGSLFSAAHVNALRTMLARHLHLDHELVCVTDQPAGIDGDVRIVPMPTTYAHTIRCRRRMQMYDREFAAQFGTRMLALDLDVVLVDDITPIVDRKDPIVCWKVGHAGVYSGSFVLCDVGALHGAWSKFKADPQGWPDSLHVRGTASDQAMLNAYLAGRPQIPFWTERHGFVTFYGAGYERFESMGVGPGQPRLPKGARIVVLGSADLAALSDERYDWIREHYPLMEVSA
jgi:hypothetical protein